jgi:hypothetical protein
MEEPTLSIAEGAVTEMDATAAEGWLLPVASLPHAKGPANTRTSTNVLHTAPVLVIAGA